MNHFLILGERHLVHVVQEFVAHYNEACLHQARDNVPLPERNEPVARILKFPTGAVKCKERLGSS